MRNRYSKKIKHVNRYPSAPTPDQLNAYHVRLWSERVNLGLSYQSGPRRGAPALLRRGDGPARADPGRAVVKRAELLGLLKYAGYHADRAAFVRLLVENNVSIASAGAAYARGIEARKAGQRCGCADCNAAAVARAAELAKEEAEIAHFLEHMTPEQCAEMDRDLAR